MDQAAHEKFQVAPRQTSIIDSVNYLCDLGDVAVLLVPLL